MDCRVTVSQIRDIQNKFQVWEAEHQLNREIRINAKNLNNDVLYFVFIHLFQKFSQIHIKILGVAQLH